jgi:hypothetical protein
VAALEEAQPMRWNKNERATTLSPMGHIGETDEIELVVCIGNVV